MASKYAELGVDVKKKGIKVFEPLVRNLFPKAFCQIVIDPDNLSYGLIQHTDGAGSKPVQNYLCWKETGEVNWFRGIAQDVVAMNVDDVLCVGARPLLFVDYVSLNPFTVPKAGLLNALSRGFDECLRLLKAHGIEIQFGGGETADIPDQLRTLDVSGTVYGRVKLSNVISGEKIRPGDVIIGLGSGGKAKYEAVENSGIMCNGITLARHCLMKKGYGKKYPETISAGKKGYWGRFAADDYSDELRMTVGEAITSPSRLFAPIVSKILERHRGSITGLVHNTGGGQTKCLRLGRNIHYIKDDILAPDPIFYLIQRESKESWRSMFRDFNMGTGFEIIAKSDHAEDILSITEKFGVRAKIIGKCEKRERGNRLTIRSEFGRFEYR